MIKYLLMMYFLIFVFGVNAQRTSESTVKVVDEIVINEATYSFVPVKKLQNREIWQRVSEYRFECGFLRLAIEWDNGEYVLLEMDGGKRELQRDRSYKVSTKMILKLTLNSVPNFSQIRN